MISFKRFVGLSGMCLAPLLAPSSSLADVVNLPIAAETFINAGLPDNNAGTNAWFDAGTDGVGGVRRALLRFDLSSIPAGSTITSAVVQLTVIKVPGGGAVNSTFGFFRLEASWNEGNKGGNKGALATAGEATWKNRMFGTANWTTAGAADDAAATASAMTAVGATFNATYFWGSAALISDVQFWLDNPSMNFGWLLRSDAEASSRSVRGFAARESGASAGVLQVGFVPSGAPLAHTVSATATGEFTNTLNGVFNPAGTDTRVWFEWGTTPNYGNLTPARAIGSGSGNTNWSEILMGLVNDVTYHFRAVASNAFGVAFGADVRFRYHEPLQFTGSTVRNGQLTVTWSGTGDLEWAPTVGGPWTPFSPAPASPYTEDLLVNQTAQMKFFLLRTEAQAYSPNAMGYVKLSLQPGTNLIQNPLEATVAGGNTVSNLLAGVPDGTTVYKWVGTGFTVNDYTSLFGWTDPQMTLAPGEGAVLYLPGPSVFTLFFAGEVKQGPLATPLVAGFNLVGSQVPQAGRVDTELGFPVGEGDTVYQWDPQTGVYKGSTFEFGEWVNPTIAVAEAFWVNKVAAGTWTHTFSINP